jgi:hypothetical protein
LKHQSRGAFFPLPTATHHTTNLQASEVSADSDSKEAEAASAARDTILGERLCKVTVELDRVMAAREANYSAGLYSMMHSSKMAKHDLLVGIPKEREEWTALHDLFV